MWKRKHHSIVASPPVSSENSETEQAEGLERRALSGSLREGSKRELNAVQEEEEEEEERAEEHGVDDDDDPPPSPLWPSTMSLIDPFSPSPEMARLNTGEGVASAICRTVAPKHVSSLRHGTTLGKQSGLDDDGNEESPVEITSTISSNSAKDLARSGNSRDVAGSGSESMSTLEGYTIAPPLSATSFLSQPPPATSARASSLSLQSTMSSSTRHAGLSLSRTMSSSSSSSPLGEDKGPFLPRQHRITRLNSAPVSSAAPAITRADNAISPFANVHSEPANRRPSLPHYVGHMYSKARAKYVVVLRLPILCTFLKFYFSSFFSFLFSFFFSKLLFNQFH